MLEKKQKVFISKVSKMGEKKLIIIPMQWHKDFDNMVGHTVKVIVEDLMPESNK